MEFFKSWRSFHVFTIPFNMQVNIYKCLTGSLTFLLTFDAVDQTKIKLFKSGHLLLLLVSDLCFCPIRWLNSLKTYTCISWRQLRYVEILRCLSKNRLDTKMLRVHSFSFSTIKRPLSLIALAPFAILISWRNWQMCYNYYM